MGAETGWRSFAAFELQFLMADDEPYLKLATWRIFPFGNPRSFHCFSRGLQEFDPRVGGFELPVHDNLALVPLLLQRRHFSLQLLHRLDPTIQALAAQHAQLDLRHV